MYELDITLILYHLFKLFLLELGIQSKRII